MILANRAVTIIGMSDDGCVSLSSRAMGAITKAQVLAGGERHLAFFPEFQGRRITFKTKICDEIGPIAELAQENNVCVLASGDPLFFGIGGLLAKKLGGQHVEFLPQPSSMQWAFARVGLKWDDALLLSFHGRPLAGFLMRIRRAAKVACFTDEQNSPSALAQHMLHYGESGWTAWVCENLGSIQERVRSFSIAELAACTDIGPLNVLILRREDAAWRPPATVPYLHEDNYAKRMPKKGLITKREARVLSIAALGLRPQSVVWDVGAGSGSISIESAMLACEGRVYAIEVDPQGVEICRENLCAHAIDNVRVIEGQAPDALENLEDPDAVFVGGSKGNMRSILELCLKRLKPAGRLVVNAITLENVTECYQTLRSLDYEPEITLLNAARGEPLAHYFRYEAQNPIHIFAVSKLTSSEDAIS